MSIDSELETTSFDIRERIDEVVEINPARHHSHIETIDARRNAKEDNLLTRDVNAFGQQFGKELRQPWTTGKHVTDGHDLFARLRSNRTVRCWRFNRLFAVIDSDRSRGRGDCLHRASRQQYTRIRLEYAPRDLGQRHLRIRSR